MKPLKIHELTSKKKKGEGLLRRLLKKKNAKKSNADVTKGDNKRRRNTSSSMEEMEEEKIINSKPKKVKNSKGKRSVKNEKAGKKVKKNAPTKITKLINNQESLEKEVIPKINKEDKIEKKVSFSNLIEKQMHPRLVDETEDEEENKIEKEEEKSPKVNTGKQTNLMNDYMEYFEKNKPSVTDPTQFAIRKHLSVIGMKYPKNSVSFFSDEYFPKAITARPSIMEPKLEEDTYFEPSSFYDNDANFKSWMQFNKAQSIILQGEDLQISNFASNKDTEVKKRPQLGKKKKTSKSASRRRKLKNRHSTISSSYTDKEGNHHVSFSLDNIEHTNKKFGKVKRKKSTGSDKSKSKRNAKTGVKKKKKSIGTEYELTSHKKSISKEMQGKQKEAGKHISLGIKKTIEKEATVMVQDTEQQKIGKQEVSENVTESNTNENIQKELSNEVKIEKKYESVEETVTERLRKIKAVRKEENQKKEEQQDEPVEKRINEATKETEEGNNDANENKRDPKLTHEFKKLIHDMKEEHEKKEKENRSEEEKTKTQEIIEINKEERLPLIKKVTRENLYNDIKQSFSFMNKNTVHRKKPKEEKIKKTKKTDSLISLKSKNGSENYSEQDPLKREAGIIIKKYLYAKEKARKKRKPRHLLDLSVNHSEVKVNTINMFSKIEPTTCFNDILFFMDNYRKKQKKHNDIFDFFKSTFKKQYYELEGVQAILQIFDVLIKKLMKDLGTHNIQPYFTDNLIEKIKNYEIDREMEKKLLKNIGKGKFPTMDPNNKFMKEMGLLDVIMGSDIFDAYGAKHIRYKCNRKLYLNKNFNENPLPIFLIKDWQNQEKLASFKQKFDELKRRKAIRMAEFPNLQRNQQVVCCLSGILSCFKNNCSDVMGFTTIPHSTPVHTEKFYEYFMGNQNQNHMEKRSTLSMKDVSYIMAL